MCPRFWWNVCWTYESSQFDPNQEQPEVRPLDGIFWRLCFLCSCLPSCYPCYLTRTLRRRRRRHDKVLDLSDVDCYRPTDNGVAKPLSNDLNQTIHRTVSNTKNRCKDSGNNNNNNNNEALPDVDVVVGVEDGPKPKPEPVNVIQVNVIILQSATSLCLQKHLYGSTDETDGPTSSDQDNSNQVTSNQSNSDQAPTNRVTLRRKKVSIQRPPALSYLSSLSVVREEAEADKVSQSLAESQGAVGGKRPSIIRRWSQLGAFGSTVARLSKGRRKAKDDLDENDEECNIDEGCEGVPLRRESR